METCEKSEVFLKDHMSKNVLKKRDLGIED